MIGVVTAGSAKASRENLAEPVAATSAACASCCSFSLALVRGNSATSRPIFASLKVVTRCMSPPSRSATVRQ